MSRKQFRYARKSSLEIKLFSPKKQKVLLECKDGVLKIYDENGRIMSLEQIEFIRSRERCKKKDKIISCIEDCGIMSLDVEKYISSFDEIFAVDTNTKKIGSIYYSIGILARLAKDENGKLYRIEISRIVSSENNILKPEMEQAVWNGVIDEIEKMGMENRKIGLVVDCDLENIGAYNRRELKIRNNKLLPRNFTLLYATADVNDNFL